MKRLFLLFLSFYCASCAYRFGNVSRTIPGGFKQIAIPVFKNLSQEPAIEVSFTNSLRKEFQRSHVAKMVDDSLADASIIGEITSVQYLPGAKKTSDDPSAPYLPSGTVLATEYRIIVSATVRVERRSDGQVIWASGFSGERTYIAPQVTVAGVNTVNPLYNLSSRRQNIEVIANDMMAEAHGRITENF